VQQDDAHAVRMVTVMFVVPPGTARHVMDAAPFFLLPVVLSVGRREVHMNSWLLLLGASVHMLEGWFCPLMSRIVGFMWLLRLRAQPSSTDCLPVRHPNHLTDRSVTLPADGGACALTCSYCIFIATVNRSVCMLAGA
jgi:hypothetical protein